MKWFHEVDWPESDRAFRNVEITGGVYFTVVFFEGTLVREVILRGLSRKISWCFRVKFNHGESPGRQSNTEQSWRKQWNQE